MKHMAAIFADDVDHRLVGRLLVGSGEKDNLFLHLHVGGPADRALGRLCTGPKMLRNRALLIEGKEHEALDAIRGLSMSRDRLSGLTDATRGKVDACVTPFL